MKQPNLLEKLDEARVNLHKQTLKQRFKQLTALSDEQNRIQAMHGDPKQINYPINQPRNDGVYNYLLQQAQPIRWTQADTYLHLIEQRQMNAELYQHVTQRMDEDTR